MTPGGEAKLRWRIEHNTVIHDDGTTWQLPEDMDPAALYELTSLPHHYLQLGHRCADLQEDARIAKRDLETARAETAAIQKQYDAIVNSDIDTLDRKLAILVNDMEESLNLLIRITVALGIQPGGEFFDKIKQLVEKYGMTMHYAKDYKYEGTISTLGEGPHTVSINKKGHVEAKPVLEAATIGELPPCDYIVPATDEDPFDYHITVREIDPDEES